MHRPVAAFKREMSSVSVLGFSGPRSQRIVQPPELGNTTALTGEYGNNRSSVRKKPTSKRELLLETPIPDSPGPLRHLSGDCRERWCSSCLGRSISISAMKVKIVSLWKFYSNANSRLILRKTIRLMFCLPTP